MSPSAPQGDTTLLPSSSGVRLVLIETQQPGNLGAVARAMGNMGFSELCLVQPQADRNHNDAKAMAMAAYPLLQQVRFFEKLTDALEGCHTAIGFTRRIGRQRREFLEMKELASFVQTARRQQEKVALIFGPESRGFTTEEANACQLLVRIPSTEKCPSLNLAQAVMVVCYELQRKQWQFEEMSRSGAATIEDLEGMYAHLQETLETVSFTDEQNPVRIPRVLRRFFNRARPTKQEVRVIRGLCRNVLHQLKNK